MMNRRRAILGGLAAVGLAGLAAWGLGHVALEAEIASILRRRLGFLKLDPNGVHAFAKDQTDATFHKKIPTWNRLRYHLLAAAAPSYKRFFRSNDTRSRVARLEDNLISTYLLSSDFFLNGADESRTVNYVAYYDPLRPCQNPFARLAVDPAAT
ncbi:MAG: hypothetical protein ACLQO1_23775 [Steroidobacteraceae bacterium]